MLQELFPRVHHRYESLPILGPILAPYAAWLVVGGHPTHRVLTRMRTAVRLEGILVNHGMSTLVGASGPALLACGPATAREDFELSAMVRCLHRYLLESGQISCPPTSRVEEKVREYRAHLERMRGLSRSSVTSHTRTATEFLNSLGFETRPDRLAELTATDLEEFIRATGKRLGRASLQHVVSYLRGFLRFLVSTGELRPGLDVGLDTPRLYRGERLPRSLPWATVEALLHAIDRTTVIGRRDYAMFLLIATYGLRPSDIVALQLGDIAWRGGTLKICQRKTGVPLLLPLTDEVGAALVEHLRGGRPRRPLREVFCRSNAPFGRMRPQTVSEAFRALGRRFGLAPARGVQCLRHTFAVHLLRAGTTLRTIGELLGHRTAEATCVYLRLAVEDLRAVALDLPVGARLNTDGQK